MKKAVSPQERALLTRLGVYAGAGRPRLSDEERAERRAARLERDRAPNRDRSRKRRLARIATCDFETDPFDNEHRERRIEPFLFVLYRSDYDPEVFWRDKNEPEDDFIRRIITFIETMEGEYVIYAHNGGKFDYMYILKLLRGEVLFKGSGLMNAKIGNHVLRDSLHICPGRLANYRKTEIDYNIMTPKRRNVAQNKKKIIEYCIDDCRFLHERVTHFVEKHGLRLSVGQAAMTALKKVYKTKRLSAASDNYFREFYFGGRVECIQGRQWYKGPLIFLDVNQMYPYVMATYEHPVDNVYYEHAGPITPHTVFIEVTCRNKRAFLQRIKGDNGPEVTSEVEHGTFYTTIWEYNVAMEYGLISDIEIHRCIDFPNRTTFEKFILPETEKRVALKHQLAEMETSAQDATDAYYLARREADDIKNLTNNSYGKFAQDPRRYIDCYITDPHEEPPAPEDGELDWGYGHAGEFIGTAFIRTPTYWIWQRPSPGERFNNVATGASITGAARATLLRAIQHAEEPLYCDTDSLLCRGIDPARIDLDAGRLGAWKLEGRFDEAILVAKKGYFLANSATGEVKMRFKGVSNTALCREVYERLYRGEEVKVFAMGVTMSKDGGQLYMQRTMRATAKKKG